MIYDASRNGRLENVNGLCGIGVRIAERISVCCDSLFLHILRLFFAFLCVLCVSDMVYDKINC